VRGSDRLFGQTKSKEVYMFEFLPESAGNLAGIRATGTLTDADYKNVLLPKLDQMFATFGRLRILLYMDDGFEGWDLHAVWDDAALGLKHRADFEKIAVVGGPDWVGLFVKLSAFLIAGQTRVFSTDRLVEAWSWLKEP
jgi:hypothetical protein